MSKVRVNNRKVCCHGDENDEGSGHPLIYLDMGEEEEIACPYCEKTFVHDCTVEAVGKLTRDERIRSAEWQNKVDKVI